MTREERQLQLLADLRAAGVEEAHFHGGELVFVRLWPAPRAPAAPSDDRPPPRPKLTEDERLMGPLGILDKAKRA